MMRSNYTLFALSFLLLFFYQHGFLFIGLEDQILEDMIVEVPYQVRG